MLLSRCCIILALIWILLVPEKTNAQCTADVGTYRVFQNDADVTGSSDPIYLYPSDKFEVRSNQDYSLPTPVAGEVAELFFMLLECPPTQSILPHFDPCRIGFWTGENLIDNNETDGLIVSFAGKGRLFFSPITADDGDNDPNANDGIPTNGVIGIDNNGDGCYDYNIADDVETYWLNEITALTLNGCNNGNMRVVASGGLPEFDAAGSKYIITNNGNGSITGTPAGHNELFFISGLNDGDDYDITISDNQGRISTRLTGTYTEVSAGTNGNIITCSNDPNISLFNQLGGSPASGGSWSDSLGNSVSNTYNTGNGGGVFTYTVTHPSNPTCKPTAQVQITEFAGTSTNFQTSASFCQSDSITNLFTLLPGTPTTGGTWLNTSGASFDGNFNPGTDPAGNYTYSESPTNPCDGDSYTVNISVSQPPEAGDNTSISICDNESSIKMFTSLNGSPESGGTFFRPSGNSFNGTIKPSSDISGQYLYVVSENNCPNDTATLTLNINPSPIIDLINSASIEIGETYTINPVASLYTSFSWSPPDYLNNSSILTPTVVPDALYSQEEYTLSLQNSNCTTEASIMVRVERDLTIPSGFTPNDDGFNDVWEIDNLSLYPDADIVVFNRYGTVVYKGIGADSFWNGKRNGELVPAGTYFYVIELKSPTKQSYNGIVTIVR